MHRIILGLVVVALLLFAPANRFPSPRPATAQQNDAGWFAYLLLTHSIEPTDLPILVQVDEQGTTHTYKSPLPTNSGFWNFSPDGQYVAYCEPSDTATQMVMWGIKAEQPLWSRNFGSSSTCAVSRWAFNPAGDEVVVGIGSNNATAGDGPHWRIVVLNASNGDITSELNDQMHSALVMGLDVFGDVVLMPLVRNFTDHEVIFVLADALAMINSAQLQAYRWSLDDATIQTADHWGTIIDFLPATGERLFIESESTPATSTLLPVGNSLKIADANGTYAIYQNPAISILDAIFANNGQAVLVYGLNPSNGAYELVQITRDGATHPLDATGRISALRAAPDGFVLTRLFFNSDAPYSSQLEFYHGAEVSILWQMANNVNDPVYATVIFSRPTPTDPDLAPFPAIP